MKKLFNEFFRIPKQGKIHEKTIITRLVLTITIVIVCLIGMSVTAYAYFSYNVTSAANVIKATSFKTELQIQIIDSNGTVSETANPITTNYKLYKISDLKIGEWYTVTVKPKQTETSAKTGFVIVKASGCNETYHTQQLGKDTSVAGGETPQISFRLMVTETTDVILESHWGTSSYYPNFQNKDDSLYITNGEDIKLVVNNFKKPNIKKNDTHNNKNKATENTQNTASSNNPTTSEHQTTQTIVPFDSTSSTMSDLTEIYDTVNSTESTVASKTTDSTD